MNCEIPMIVSNHPHLESIADKFRIPFYCMPIDKKGDKLSQEKKIRQLLKKQHIDLVVFSQVYADSITIIY